MSFNCLSTCSLHAWQFKYHLSKKLVQIIAARPPAATDNQDADTSSQVVKRRLPGDVKLKLAKVARIAVTKLSFLSFKKKKKISQDVLKRTRNFIFLKQASQGNLSGELINRLMSIVGHLIQVRSLKVTSIPCIPILVIENFRGSRLKLSRFRKS